MKKSTCIFDKTKDWYLQTSNKLKIFLKYHSCTSMIKNSPWITFRFINIHQKLKIKILNSQDENIQYTVETQDDDSTLSFLDITLINDGSGKYGFKVFLKPAITNVMLKPSSSVDPKMIEGVFKGFLARAKRICSDKFLHMKLNFWSKYWTQCQEIENDSGWLYKRQWHHIWGE